MALGYVRPALVEDAAGIARIQVATWRYAYRRMLPRTVLDALDEDWMAGRWRQAIGEPPTPRHRVLVAVEQAATDYLVGFAAAGPADEEARAPQEPDGALGERVAAVTDLLIEPRWGRRGHGSRLLAALVDLWRSDGFDTAVAWAYRDDVATRRFLGSAGWAPDGATRALDVEDMLVPQLRLHVDLTVARADAAGAGTGGAAGAADPGPGTTAGAPDAGPATGPARAPGGGSEQQ